MYWLGGLLLAICGLVAAVATYRAFSSPGFYVGLVAAISVALGPVLWRFIRPRDFTEWQKRRERRGQEPGLAGQNTRNNDGFHHK